jgi:hypothetical protein
MIGSWIGRRLADAIHRPQTSPPTEDGGRLSHREADVGHTSESRLQRTGLPHLVARDHVKGTRRPGPGLRWRLRPPGWR